MRWCSGGASNTFACKRPPPKKTFALFCGITFRDLFHVVSYRMKYFFTTKEEAGKKRIKDSFCTILDSSNVSLKIK